MINVDTRSIEQTNIGIVGDRLVVGAVDGKEMIDLEGAFVSPGFIDAHMHVESPMLPPSSFANLAVPHRHLPGDENEISGDDEGNIIGRRRGRFWQFDTEFGKVNVDITGHVVAPSLRRNRLNARPTAVDKCLGGDRPKEC